MNFNFILKSQCGISGKFEHLTLIDLVHVENFQFQIFIDLVLVSKMLISATPCPPITLVKIARHPHKEVPNSNMSYSRPRNSMEKWTKKFGFI